MNPERQQALDYLRAPADGLWRWAENGAVVVWRDGSTVAFREEILEILDWLSPGCLPSFGAIVLLLAACRGKVATVEDILVDPKGLLTTGKNAGVLVSVRGQMRLQLSSALGELQKVERLPAELKTGIRARCVLAEAVFETARAERHVQAGAVLLGMRGPLSEMELLGQGGNGSGGANHVRQVRVVAEGLKQHTAESLALRLRTGLDALPRDSAAGLPMAERARKLIEDLSHDPEMGMVARAARELMAAVRLPRRLGARDQLAIGGVSDITNRGPLDRLLLSELAHDDLTLSVRVALNEALYLRREPPMREPPGTLGLLLDSGVRLWGIPRVLATSVALALVACDRRHSAVRAWRAHGTALCPLELLNRDGLIQHLSALEVEAHPGEALPAFTGSLSTEAHHQSVIITHRDALDDPDFRRSLTALSAQPGFVATVDRAGHFELHTLPLAHRPPLCAAQLNLETILHEKSVVPPRRLDPLFPAIFGLPVFPLRLPVTGRLDYWVETADGWVHAVLDDRRLVKFQGTRTGATALAADLPPGKTLWMDAANGVVHLVKAGAKQRAARLVTVPADGEPARVTGLVGEADVLAIHRYGGVILVIRHEDIRAWALSDGRMLGRSVNPHRWVHGRFFRGEGGFLFASWDGTGVRFEPVTVPAAFNTVATVLVFDREGFEGPWLVQRNGLVVSSVSSKQHTLPMPRNPQDKIETAHASRDGHRVVYWTLSAQWGLMKDLKSGAVTNWPAEQGKATASESPPDLPTWNLYQPGETLHFLPRGLAFQTQRRIWRKLTLDESGRLRIGEWSITDRPVRPPVTFASQPILTARGCTLRIAEWPGGKAFLDCRGLLHLKSANSAVPEVSLVLSDREVAGWTSDGFVCGPAFFLEDSCSSEPVRVFERFLRILNS